jgi:hypothetical protein
MLLKLDLVPEGLGYSTTRYAETDEIRFGFGSTLRAIRPHLPVVTIEMKVLDVYIAATGDLCEAMLAKRDDPACAKKVALDFLMGHFAANPGVLSDYLHALRRHSFAEGVEFAKCQLRDWLTSSHHHIDGEDQ